MFRCWLGLVSPSLYWLPTLAWHFGLMTAGLMMPLHTGKFVGLFVAVFVHFAIVLRDEHYGWPLAPLWSAYGWIFSLLIVIGTIYVLKRALEFHFLSGKILAGFVAIWLVYAATAITSMHHFPFSMPLPAKALCYAMICLPLASVAAAPLAFAANRHR